MMEYWNIGYKSGKDIFYKIDRIHLNPSFQHSSIPVFSAGGG
jgi:hypothetical protein